METANDTAHTCLVKIRDSRGLHLHLATAISKACRDYPGVTIRIRRPDCSRVVDGRSPLDMVCLEASGGATVQVDCIGDGAELLLARLRKIISTLTFEDCIRKSVKTLP